MKSDGLCNDSDIEAAGMNRFEQLQLKNRMQLISVSLCLCVPWLLSLCLRVPMSLRLGAFVKHHGSETHTYVHACMRACMRACIFLSVVSGTSAILSWKHWLSMPKVCFADLFDTRSE